MAEDPKTTNATSFLRSLDDEDYIDVIQGALDGAPSMAHALGVEDDSFRALEAMGVGFYQSGDYKRASEVFAGMLGLHMDCAPAWRGLGGCAQALKEYGMAALCYNRAIDLDPDDVPSKVFAAECVLMEGATETGLKLLSTIIDAGTKNHEYLPYITRARTLLKFGGKQPPSLKVSSGDSAGEDDPATEPPVDPKERQRPITLDDIREHPTLGPEFEALLKDVKAGRVAMADVGGFTDEELKAAYLIACRYVEADQPLEAMKVLGFLVAIAPHRADLNQLVGIVMQRMKLWGGAAYYYQASKKLDPRSFRTRVYLGEALMMSGKEEDGAAELKDALSTANLTDDDATLRRRAQTLIDRVAKD